MQSSASTAAELVSLVVLTQQFYSTNMHQSHGTLSLKNTTGGLRLSIISIHTDWLFLGQVRIGRWQGQEHSHRSNKSQKSLFPQYVTSIGNNFGSIKHKAMMFVCSKKVSATGDWMVWLLPLPRHWKWPTISKCTYSCSSTLPKQN